MEHHPLTIRLKKALRESDLSVSLLHRRTKVPYGIIRRFKKYTDTTLTVEHAAALSLELLKAPFPTHDNEESEEHS